MSAQLPTVILSPEFSGYPKQVIGNTAWQIGQWLKLNTPLPEMILIPSSALEHVLKHNPPQVNNQKKLFIPHQLKHQIIHHYHHFLESDFVKIRIEKNGKQDEIAIENVKGDANLIQNITQIWLESIDQEVGNKSNTNIFITRQPQADISGVIYTHHPMAHSKAHYLVEAVQGVWTDNVKSEQKDIYQVDIRTHAVINQRKRTQNLIAKRIIDGVIHSKPSDKNNTYLLNATALKTLSYLTHAVALHQFEPLKIQFSIKNRRLFIETITILNFDDLPKQSAIGRQMNNQHKLPVKLHLELKSLGHLSKIQGSVDGVVFSHQPAITLFGFYPPAIMEQKQSRLLRLLLDKQWQKINTYLNHHRQTQIFFKPTDLTSEQASKLKFSPKRQEVNADLGFRGAINMLHDSRLLKLELSLIRKNWPSKQKLNFILPLTRSPIETLQIMQLIQQELPKFKLDLWLEVSNANTVLTLDQYPLRKFKGLIINTKLLQATSMGYDPQDQHLQQTYVKHTLGLTRLLNILKTKLKITSKQLEVIIHLDRYHHDLISQAVNNHWQVITNPFELEQVKLAVLDNTRRQLKSKKDKNHGSH